MSRVRSKIQDPFFWSDWLVVVAFVFVIAFFGAIAPAEADWFPGRVYRDLY
ncbi:MAG: hypothetical protein RL096_661 [Actinomycetota bacterium]